MEAGIESGRQPIRLPAGVVKYTFWLFEIPCLFQVDNAISILNFKEKWNSCTNGTIAAKGIGTRTRIKDLHNCNSFSFV